MAQYKTRFGSLKDYCKGGVQVMGNDDPRNYAFSNIFEVASNSRPYEKVAVARNVWYVLEAIRAEGTSEWRIANHDEIVLVMDGEVEIRLVKPDDSSLVSAGQQGSIAIEGTPQGPAMGVIRARHAHMALLPANCAYQFSAARPAVLLMQTIAGVDTIERWAEICQGGDSPARAPGAERAR